MTLSVAFRLHLPRSKGEDSQVLGGQHPQAGSEENDLLSEDTEVSTIGAVLRSSDTRPADDTNDVSTLDVLVLLLERNIALGVLELAHDLDGLSLGLADVEAEGVRGRTDRHDPQANLNLDICELLTSLEVLVVEQEVRQAGVCVELVRVWVGVLGGAQGVDLVTADLEVLVRVPGRVSTQLASFAWIGSQLDLGLLGLALSLGALGKLCSLLCLLLLDLRKSIACPPDHCGQTNLSLLLALLQLALGHPLAGDLVQVEVGGVLGGSSGLRRWVGVGHGRGFSNQVCVG